MIMTSVHDLYNQTDSLTEQLLAAQERVTELEIRLAVMRARNTRLRTEVAKQRAVVRRHVNQESN